MSAYTQHPGGSVEVTSIGGIRYALDAPLTWEVGRKGSGLWYVVPTGAETDLASIPAAVRWWLNPADARFAKAAILHDTMLAEKDWSRATAAAEFYNALRADDVGALTAAVMFAAVLEYTTLIR